MTFSRLAGWLVEPASASFPDRLAAPPERTAVSPPALGLLCSAADAPSLGAAVALRLTRGPAVVTLWGTDGDVSAAAPGRSSVPATPGARRVAASLAARDVAVVVAGRLVVARLPEGARATSAVAARIAAATADVPGVLVGAGPRSEALDALLAERDVVLVHARDDALADLTIARLAEQGLRATRLPAAPGAFARTLARAGLALPGGLRALDIAVAAQGRAGGGR